MTQTLSKHRIFTIAICALAGLLAPVLPGCHKEAPATEAIEGMWKQQSTPYAYYQFTDGRCIRQVIDFEKEVWRNEYAYTVDGHALNMVDLFSGKRDTWHLVYTDENSVTVQMESSPIKVTMKRYPQ